MDIDAEVMDEPVDHLWWQDTAVFGDVVVGQELLIGYEPSSEGAW